MAVILNNKINLGFRNKMNSISKILLTTTFSIFALSACNGDGSSKTEATTSASASEESVAQTEASATTVESKATPAPTSETTSEVADTVPTDKFIEGQHYRVLNFDLPTEAPEGKVEVAELFWYGCPHCFHLEPTMLEYQKEKSDNVYFRRVPATLNPDWVVHAKAYYIGRLLDADNSKQMHKKIFDAIHKQRRRLMDDESIKSFFVSQGFSEEEFDNAANSMEVQAKIKTATEYSTASQATGVPTLIVNGKYMTSPTMAQGSAKLKRILKFLAEKDSK